jgi:hypothetical protein
MGFKKSTNINLGDLEDLVEIKRSEVKISSKEAPID